MHFWDHEKDRVHMSLTGQFSTQLDDRMGMSLDDLEGLSIRQKRQIIKSRISEMLRLERLKIKNRHKSQFADVSHTQQINRGPSKSPHRNLGYEEIQRSPFSLGDHQ